ncbi:hypothetical protein KL928_004733, partial [Ogataea angusta]
GQHEQERADGRPEREVEQRRAQRAQDGQRGADQPDNIRRKHLLHVLIPNTSSVLSSQRLPSFVH